MYYVFSTIGRKPLGEEESDSTVNDEGDGLMIGKNTTELQATGK